METVKRLSLSKAERMAGPRLPPAPTRMTFLMGDHMKAKVGRVRSKTPKYWRMGNWQVECTLY